MNRCHTCDKPIATPEDFKNIPGGEGEHLCWSEYSKHGCEPVDWRERAVAAEKELQRSTDWYQQRFNRLRKWVKEEVEPLSADVAHRYFSICANGSPASHESADWVETMHGLKVRAEAAERARDSAQSSLKNAMADGADAAMIWGEKLEASKDEIEKLRAAIQIVCDHSERIERERDYWKKLAETPK